MTIENKYTCVTPLTGVGFCYPSVRDKEFVLAIDPEAYPNEAVDPKVISDLFGGIYRSPMPIRTSYDLGQFNGWRTYNVTSRLHPSIPEKVWTDEYYPGPNCFQAAFCAVGFDHVCDRYVDSSEAKFLLSRFFKIVSRAECGQEIGAIAVFKETRLGFGMQEFMAPRSDTDGFIEKKEELRRHAPLARLNLDMSLQRTVLPYYDVGTHMAYSLVGGLVFHKLSWRWNDGYRIDPIDSAMKQVEDAAESHLPPFERGRGSRKERRFSYQCYRRDLSRTQLTGEIAWTSPQRLKYLELLRYYSNRVLDIARGLKENPEAKPNRAQFFDKHRMSLLTVENYWHVMKAFRREIGSDMRNVFAEDLVLAQAFYAADSLSWQYQTMSDTYYPLKEGRPSEYYNRKMTELYSRYYFKFDQEFRKEIELHLALQGVPMEKRNQIIDAVISELQTQEGGKPKYDISEYVNSNGTKGAPFFEILDSAISQQGL